VKAKVLASEKVGPRIEPRRRRVLLFPEVRVYAGSLAEWGNHDDLPVER
jgi:hypothetical protein